ncbi:MAG: energy-coupling factor transporter transmembrane component T family protein [Candidatus Heimdallarchaeota archaeon]
MAFSRSANEEKAYVSFNLDPRTKLLVLMIVSLLSVAISDFFFLLMLFDFVILFTILSKADIMKIWKYVKHTIWLVIPVFLIQTIFSYVKDGPLVILPDSWGNIGGFVLISTGSLFYAGSICLRILILAVSSSLFSLTTDSNDFLLALRKIGFPYEIAIVTGLIIYFLPMVITETTSVSNALETRGVSIRKGRFLSRLKTFKILITAILMNFIEKSKYQAMAMDSRGFNSKIKKTTLCDLKLKLNDYVVMIVIVAIFAGILYYFWEEINFLGNIFDYLGDVFNPN